MYYLNVSLDLGKITYQKLQARFAFQSNCAQHLISYTRYALCLIKPMFSNCHFKTSSSGKRERRKEERKKEREKKSVFFISLTEKSFR